MSAVIDRRGAWGGKSGRAAICLLALFAFLWLPAPSHARWDAESRAAVAAGWDSNPREWVEAGHRSGDSFQRLEWSLGWRQLGASEGAGGSAGSPVGASLEFRWGTERYTREASENRHLLLLRSAYRWNAMRGWSEAYLDLSGRYFPHQQEEAGGEDPGNRDSDRLETGLRGLSRLGWDTDLQWRVHLVGLHRRPGPAGLDRSRAAAQAAGELRWKRTPSWTALASLEGEGLWYREEALGSPAGELEGGVAVPLGYDRKDGSFSLGIGAETLSPADMRMTAAFQRVWSNSVGVPLSRVQLDVSIGTILPWRMSGHLLARWYPYYEYDDGRRLFDPTLDVDDPDDTEFAERNRVVLSLQRPLAGDFGVELQAGWHRNESLIPFADYEKTQVQAVLHYRAGSR